LTDFNSRPLIRHLNTAYGWVTGGRLQGTAAMLRLLCSYESLCCMHGQGFVSVQDRRLPSSCRQAGATGLLCLVGLMLDAASLPGNCPDCCSVSLSLMSTGHNFTAHGGTVEALAATLTKNNDANACWCAVWQECFRYLPVAQSIERVSHNAVAGMMKTRGPAWLQCAVAA
jgi:hypothetical protein